MTVVLLTVLAVARVTRFITQDFLLTPVRNAVIRRLVRDNDESKIAYLILCDWCTSVYVGAAAACAYAAWGESMPYMATVLALSASYATGFLASVTERGE